MRWQDRATNIWQREKPALPQIASAIALSLLTLQLGIALFEYARLARAALAFPFPLDYGVLLSMCRLEMPTPSEAWAGSPRRAVNHSC
jgi:hypothetical protein